MDLLILNLKLNWETVSRLTKLETVFFLGATPSFFFQKKNRTLFLVEDIA